MRKVDSRALLRQVIPWIEEERQIWFECNQNQDGVVRDRDARTYIRKFDRWLEKAKAATS